MLLAICLSFVVGMAAGMFLLGMMIQNIASKNGGRYTFYTSDRVVQSETAARPAKFGSSTTSY